LRSHGKLRVVTVNLPEAYIKAIDELIKLRLYASRSELIRTAVRNLIQKYMHEAGIE